MNSQDDFRADNEVLLARLAALRLQLEASEDITRRALTALQAGGV